MIVSVERVRLLRLASYASSSDKATGRTRRVSLPAWMKHVTVSKTAIS